MINISKRNDQNHYSPQTIVLGAEFIKLIASGLICSWDKVKRISWLLEVSSNGKKVLVVVILYSISNMLPFYAIPLIGAPIYSVFIQLKTLTTAGFARIMLGKNISWTKWRALMLLVIGCILVASPILNQPSLVNDLENNTNTKINASEQIIGLSLCLLVCLISGFSSVYLESILKQKDHDGPLQAPTLNIWDRNFQLSLYSIFVLLAYFICTFMYRALLSSTSSAATHTLIDQNTSYTTGTNGSSIDLFGLCIMLMQAIGGILVAATLKFADAILKCYSTSFAIVLTSLLGYFFLHSDIDIFVALGMLISIISIMNYSLDESLQI